MSETLLAISLIFILSGILLFLSLGLFKNIINTYWVRFINHYNNNSVGVYNIINKKSDYDYGECCCGGSCGCGCDHRVAKGKNKPILSDVPLAWGLYFQDGASPSFEGIVELHNRIMFYLIVILFGVSWILSSVIIHFNKSENKIVYKHLNHGICVPIQKYSKFNNIIFNLSISNRMYIPLRSYCTISFFHGSQPSVGEPSNARGNENISAPDLSFIKDEGKEEKGGPLH